MAVYVDDAKLPYGCMIMCHMWADTREELLAMADLIKVSRRWFQRPDAVGGPGMNASWEHFDISQTKRQLAIAAGAIETDRYGPAEHVARLRNNPTTLANIAYARTRRKGSPT